MAKCEDCGKQNYPSMLQAIRVALKRSGITGSGLRPYRCPVTPKQWHLSSKPRRRRRG